MTVTLPPDGLPLTDDELKKALRDVNARGEKLLRAVIDIRTVAEDGDDDLFTAANLVTKEVNLNKARRDLLVAEKSRRQKAAMADAEAHPERYDEVIIKFRHGRTPPGWKSRTKVRLINWDRGRGYVTGLSDGSWFMVGDVHHVEDLDGKYL